MSENNIRTLLRKGTELLDQKKFNQALIEFDNVITADSKNMDAYYLKGNTLKSLGLYEQALEMYKNSLNINPKSIDVILNKGLCLKKLNKTDDAIKCFNQVIYYSPTHFLAHHNKGLCLMGKSDYEGALTSFSEAVKIDPKNYGVFYNLGNCFHSLKRYQDAISNYNISLSLKTDFSDAYFNKGNSLDELGCLDEAIECYNLALKYNSKMSDAHFNKGIVLNKKKDYKVAIQCYDTTIKLNKYNDEAFYRKGVCLEELKEYNSAIETFSEAIKLAPENPSYLSERAKIYLEINEKLNGFNDLNHARKLFEENSMVKKIKEEFLSKTEKNIEKIINIEVEDVLELMSEKIELLEGNKKIRKEFEKIIKPKIKQKITCEDNGNNNNLEKFSNGNNIKDKTQTQDIPSKEKLFNDNNTLALLDNTNKAKNVKLSQDKNLQDLEVQKTSNLEKKKITQTIKKEQTALIDIKSTNSVQNIIIDSSQKNTNIAISNQTINQQSITNIKNVIQLSSTVIKNKNLPKEELKEIFDLLFTLNEKVEKHEKELSNHQKKIEQINSELEKKLTNNKKELIEELTKLVEKGEISEETKNLLLDYFHGFNSCFNRFYITSQIIVQNQFKLDQATSVSICSYLISLIPFIGKELSVIGKGIAKYLSNMDFINKSKKFLSIAFDCTDLSQIIGKSCKEICKNFESINFIVKLHKEYVESKIKEDYNKVEKLVSNIEEKINFGIFNPKERSIHNMFGEYQANLIINRFLNDKFDLDKDYDVQFAEFINNENKMPNQEPKPNENSEEKHSFCSSLCIVF